MRHFLAAAISHEVNKQLEVRVLIKLRDKIIVGKEFGTLAVSPNWISNSCENRKERSLPKKLEKLQKCRSNKEKMLKSWDLLQLGVWLLFQTSNDVWFASQSHIPSRLFGSEYEEDVKNFLLKFLLTKIRAFLSFDEKNTFYIRKSHWHFQR